MALPEPLDPVFVGDPLPAALNGERSAINALIDEVDGRIPIPTGAQTGDLLRWDGTAWMTTDTRFFEGNGSPEGVVSAPVGSRYVDKTAHDGVVEWTKISGAGNTGWSPSGSNYVQGLLDGMVVKDTGWRNIAGLLATTTGSNIYSARVRRWGNHVDMYLDVKTPTALQGSWALLAALPGFSPGYIRYGAFSDNSEAASAGNFVDADGGVNLLNTVKEKRDRYSGTWLTSDAWPTGAQLPPAV